MSRIAKASLLFTMVVAALGLLIVSVAFRAATLATAGEEKVPGSAFREIAAEQYEWGYFTADSRIRDMAVDGNSLWAATGGGVLTFDLTDGTYTKTITVDGLASNDVLSVAIDQTGHKWFGTYTGGASEFDGAVWTTH